METMPIRRVIAASTASLILALALVRLLAPADVRAQDPTPTATPSFSFQSSASPPSGTSIVPPVPFSYSLTVSNVGQTAAGSLVIQFDTVDVTGQFSSTQGACTWTLPPDYHGHGIGECDLGALLPAGNATIALSGDTFLNFYSHDSAWARISVNSTPISQGFNYPFGTPTPAPVGGVAEIPPMEGSDSSGTNAPLIAGAGLAGGLLAVSAVWLAKKRRPASK